MKLFGPELIESIIVPIKNEPRRLKVYTISQVRLILGCENNANVIALVKSGDLKWYKWSIKRSIGSRFITEGSLKDDLNRPAARALWPHADMRRCELS